MEVPDLLLSHSRLAAWAWDVRTDTVRWSPELRVMLGYEAGDPEPNWANHQELLTPSSFRRLEAAVGRCLGSGEPYRLRLEFIGKAGKRLHVENHGAVAEWEDGKPVRLTGVCVDRTAEQRAMQSLRQTTRLLSKTAQIGRIGGWQWNLVSRQMTWSAEMYRVHGVGRDFEPTLAGMVGLYPAESRALLETVIARPEETGEPGELELDLTGPDGKRRRLRWITECEWVQGATVISGTTQDITLDHGLQTERNLLFNLSRDLLGIADFNGRYTQVNPAWTKTLGWSESEMAGRRWIDLVHPDDLEATLEAGSALERGDEVASFTNRLRCRDGSYRTVSWKAVPVPTEDRIVFVARDTTEEMSAQRELDERRRTIDAILEHSLAGYWDWHIERDEEVVSETFRRMFGYGETERDGWPVPWRRLILSEDLPKARAAFRTHAASRGTVPFSSELRCLHRDGSIMWVLAAGSVVEWSDAGAPLRMVGCCMDVTKAKLQELERHAAERALSGAALEERRRLAFHMHDGVGQLLTAASMGAKRLADSRDLADEVREEAGKIQGVVGETHRRIRAITRGLVPEEVHAGNFNGSVGRLTEACAAGFQIECRFESDSESQIPSRFVALQLYLIIQEAILNAVRHGEALVVTVKLEKVDGQLEISITDDGSGIDVRDDSDAGFAPRGLGLRSMAARARDAGGRMDIDRVPGGGTRVLCRVPAAELVEDPTIS